MQKIAVFWFRRDLRLIDNTGLYHALKGDLPVLPLFIFDTNILDELPRKDARVEFIHQQLVTINQQLHDKGTKLLVKHGKPLEVWRQLLKEYNIGQVYTNRDYEPYAKERDSGVEALLRDAGIGFNTYKDHLLLEPGEVMKDDGQPYVVFTPFGRRWREKLTPGHLETHTAALRFDNWVQTEHEQIISLEALGFEPAGIPFPADTVNDEVVRHYKQNRDYPAVNGTSRLSVHLRFGTISIRQLAQQARALSDTYLNELIWREFYAHILAHFPRVVNQSFYEKYERVPWRNNQQEFEQWCKGETGYPLVDAGMRELNETGFMHNRVRMVVASFLTKHLLIDWRWGEAYFAEKLLDFEFASNNGGWQWAAGCGTDAAPYFRVFSPEAQQKKFDPKGKYMLRWVPEYGTPAYPRPMVDHSMARQRAIDTYKNALTVG